MLVKGDEHGWRVHTNFANIVQHSGCCSSEGLEDRIHRIDKLLEHDDLIDGIFSRLQSDFAWRDNQLQRGQHVDEPATTQTYTAVSILSASRKFFSAVKVS
jgi:hypothetical protein